MRLVSRFASRFVAAIVALVLAAAMTQGLVSPASAAQPAAPAAAAAQAKTKVSLKFAANGAKSFRLYGKASGAKNKKAILLRATSKKGKYRSFKTTKTNKQGKFSFGGLKKEGYYAVRVGNGVSKVIQVCKGGC
ncbi:hypothetical protein [Nocardioides flavescens]|uniref:Carboxypeptidase regulatory-like domain-containing protein n=1 Tax=Nocardioides flavescens TaxID=2691959 RepID=A0A6L7F093_9ACTN|nr:hypothetical protein [Nocardioides flavescens]MXG90189.1 hypothetical protein [Nocardioides flavescens]